jgi:hypothetical protein
MTRQEEVQIAFNLWQLLKQLDGLLKARYLNDFRELKEVYDKMIEESLDQAFPDDHDF